ncbi:sugar nucleotide-binding protein [Thermoactinomyces sp. CICC 10523]|uniref:sugar nucleotide-binding protein n=1 Tax=Thermoactinomyces sp. CICC 10523 TaxID=2767428 RepID=UPI0018DD486F|nr:sugar nucleotide-binding protein [Thermoactinomyces sp. CICC 10523]MBH8597226.1 sugar nucleotide-binding protein [Thermoactinomyces sp. CICC 10523]
MIFGSSGTVSKALINQLSLFGNYNIYGTYNKNLPILPKEKCFQLEIGDLDKLDQILEDVKPDITFLALRGDFEKQLIFHCRVAEYQKEQGGLMYFCSTTNVFDGSIDKPHYEDDETVAESSYGQYKWNCEKELKEILSDRVGILRISEVWGKNSPRMTSLLEQLAKNQGISVYSNLYMNRTTDIVLAKQIVYLMNKGMTGTYHLGSNDMMTQADFYKQLIKALGYRNFKLEEINLPADSYFAVLAKNLTIKEMNITNREIINYLASD